MKNEQKELICKAKVHLMMATGDMPAVAQMAHVCSHAGRFGCRICEVKGVHPDNVSSGMYFLDKDAPLRPKQDFLNGNEVNTLYILL